MATATAGPSARTKTKSVSDSKNTIGYIWNTDSGNTTNVTNYITNKGPKVRRSKNVNIGDSAASNSPALDYSRQPVSDYSNKGLLPGPSNGTDPGADLRANAPGAGEPKLNDDGTDPAEVKTDLMQKLKDFAAQPLFVPGVLALAAGIWWFTRKH